MNSKQFEEKTLIKLYPDKAYPYGLHTLNSLGGITVIDGLKYLFSPFQKIKNLMWVLRKNVENKNS
jgi:hypothetical protein